MCAACALPLPGRWRMRIDALVTDFQKVTLEDDFEMRRVRRRFRSVGIRWLIAASCAFNTQREYRER